MAQTKAQLLGPVVGDVVMDVSTLSLDAEGNKVGIGTTEADLTLHVNGVNALPSSSGSTATGHLTLRAKASSSSHGMFMGVSNAAPWSSWIQAQDASNNATNYPLLLNPNGGNVGIGTNNPSFGAGSGLEVERAGAATIRIEDNSSSSSFEIQNTGGIIKQRLYNNQPWTIEYGSGEKLRITSAGLVGIGTDNPVGNLEIRDSKANLIVAKDGLTVKSNSDLATQYDLIQLGAGGALASYSTATATADTQFIHNAYRHSGGQWKYRYADSAARIRMNSPQGAIIFDNAASGSADADITFAERLRIDSAGNITLGYAGNSLHFQNGFNNSTARIQNGGGSNNSELKFLVRNAGTESEKMRLTSTAGLAVVTAGSMPANAGNETLYVMGEGHNGHGTSNTRSVVSIIGALTSNSNAAGLWIGARTNENTAVIGTRTASGNLAFETYSGGWGERLRITSGGVVGINKTSPSAHAQLDVVGSSYWPILVKTTSTSGGGIAIKNKDDITSLYTGSGGSSWLTGSVITDGLVRAQNNLLFATNGNNERLRIHAGGELSVGTVSVIGRYTFYNSGSSGSDAPSGGDKGMYVKSDMGPTHVDLTGVDNYTMQISNGAYAGTGISNPQGTITKLLFHGTTYNGWNSYGAICMDNQGASGHRGDFVFIAGGSERLRIKSNGQVNIGAALPSSGAGNFNVKPASAADSYFKIRPASEFDGAITGTAIDIRNSSNGASQHLVLRAQEFRFWCDNADKVRINSEGYYTSGNLTISGRANYGNDTIATYSQVLSDNHANTFFGQNLKLGVSGTSGNHTLKIINQHASIGGAGMLIGGNGSGRQNTINFYAESANQAPATDVTANAKMTLNTNGQLTTMGEQRIRYHTGSTDNKTSKVTTALGKSGTYSTCTVTITTHSYCSVAYDILVGGYSAAHCHRAGTYYINTAIYGSYTSISNVGGGVSAAGPIYVATQKSRWTFTKSNGFVHPICSVTVASGGDGYINHGDVSIVWS